MNLAKGEQQSCGQIRSRGYRDAISNGCGWQELEDVLEEGRRFLAVGLHGMAAAGLVMIGDEGSVPWNHKIQRHEGLGRVDLGGCEARAWLIQRGQRRTSERLTAHGDALRLLVPRMA